MKFHPDVSRNPSTAARCSWVIRACKTLTARPSPDYSTSAMLSPLPETGPSNVFNLGSTLFSANSRSGPIVRDTVGF